MQFQNRPLAAGVAAALPPLADLAVFCALVGYGLPLGSSHIASFAVALALNYLLKIRSRVAAAGRTGEAGLHLRLAAVSGMALFLRAGALGLASQVWGWPAQTAILAAIIAGMAVTGPGYAAAFSQADAEEKSRAVALGLVLYAVALRLLYMGSVELLPEETYYWNYSRHLDIGYLDHPPMVAWLIRLGTGVFGQTEFGVRAGALCCAVVASFFTYRLTRNLFGDAAAVRALLLAQALPYFFLSGFLITPDAPLTAAWAALLYFLERALIADRAAAWWGVGLALGVGMISKYTIGLLVPVTLLFMLFDVRARRWWLRWEPYAAAIVALAVFSPVVVWNAEHEWASFAFQTSRRLAEVPRFALHKLIASILVLITPTGALAVAAAFMSKKPGGDADIGRRRLFIGLSILIPLAVFTLFSLRHEVKLDWTGAPWTAALPLLAAGMIAAGPGLTRLESWVRSAWMPTLVIVLLIYGAGLQYLVLGLPGAGYGKHIELVPVAWRDLTREVTERAAAIREETGSSVLLVGMDRYAIASELAFYGAKRTQAPVETSSAHLFGGLGLMYERWTPASLQDGRNLLLVAWDPAELSGPDIEARAGRWGPVEVQTLTRNGYLVRHYYQRVAYNYKGLAQDERERRN